MDVSVCRTFFGERSVQYARLTSSIPCRLHVKPLLNLAEVHEVQMQPSFLSVTSCVRHFSNTTFYHSYLLSKVVLLLLLFQCLL
jgi:hypothetical protein